MPLVGRPEPGWIAIGSHAAQRAPGLMCGALLNKDILQRSAKSVAVQPQSDQRSLVIPQELQLTPHSSVPLQRDS